MKHLAGILFCLLLCIGVYAQNAPVTWEGENTFDNFRCQYAGVEIGGNGYLYSAFYEISIVTAGNFSLNFRPQLEYIWGSDEDSIPRHIIPILGLNVVVGQPNFYFNAGISSGLDCSYGCKHEKAYFFPVLSAGPRALLGEKFLVGLSYNYFFVKQKFITSQKSLHWAGLTIGIFF